MVPTISTSNNAGFTLVEVLVALCIALVGLMGLLQSINIAMEHNIKNHLREEATRVGEREMSAFRAGLAGRVSSASVVVPGKKFYITRISSAVGTGNVATKELGIRVCWKYRNTSTLHRVTTLRSR